MMWLDPGLSVTAFLHTGPRVQSPAESWLWLGHVDLISPFLSVQFCKMGTTVCTVPARGLAPSWWLRWDFHNSHR